MNRQLSSQPPASGLMGTLLLAGGAGIVVSLAFVFTNLFRDHHAAFGTSSDGVVWGLPVATYVFFVLASTGLTFVASLAMVFGMRQYYAIAKRCVWLAVATLVAGFAVLAFELGHPFRMIWALPLSFQVRSPMNWMGVFYALYLVFLVLKFRRMNEEDWTSAGSRNLGVASLVSVIIAHATLGLLFGMIAARPFWFGSSVPIYFLLTALLSGVAFAMLATYAAYGFDRSRMPAPVQSLLASAMPGFFAVTLGITLVALGARTITGLWSNQEGFQAFDHMVASPWFHLEVWVGMALPLLLLVMRRTRTLPGVQVLSAALVLVALFIGRYEFIVGGQVVPIFKGAWAETFVAYTPSATEIMLTVLSVSIVLALYAAGERYLRLDAAPEPGPMLADDAAVVAAAAESLRRSQERAGREFVPSPGD
jgi:Ni/Fe-hydrogenase subunit HybB-like protein